MKIFIDTNVIIDVLKNRQPFSDSARKVLTLIECGGMKGFISASSAPVIYYLIRKYIGSNSAAYYLMSKILELVKVLPVTDKNIIDALYKQKGDFEDNVQIECACSGSCKAIITGNKKDFLLSPIPVYTPDEFLLKILD